MFSRWLEPGKRATRNDIGRLSLKCFLPPISNRVTAETLLEDQPLQEVVVAADRGDDGNTPKIHSAATPTLIGAESISDDSDPDTVVEV